MNADEVVKHFGGRAELAKTLGVSYEAVRQWHQANKIPEGRQFQIQILTNGKFKAPQVA